MWALALLGCGPDAPVSPVDPSVPWSAEQLRPAARLPAVRGRTWARAIVHAHSPFSHDACDGRGYADGQVDEDCLQDLRDGVCRAGVDVVFFTDHPAHAASQPFDALLHPRAGDEAERESGRTVGLRIACDDGSSSLGIPGVEDELMPLGLRDHPGPDAATNDALYNDGSPAGVGPLAATGASVFVAHTEGRDRAWLEAVQDAGARGIEVFNAHAMFAPDIRVEHLGLDAVGWASDITPFTSRDGSAEPDLFFLAVLQDQQPSLAAWDALLARGPVVGVAGSDSHQNVLPVPLRDGERGDSYRRSFRWFSNHLLVDGPSRQHAHAALDAGRLWIVFDLLGLPAGLDLHLVDAGGGVHEIGSDAPTGTLELACPTLAPGSPRGVDEPDVRVTLLRDGLPYGEGCGAYPAEAGRVYRARVEITPRHLAPFLGDDPEPWMRPFPWALSNAIRVREPG